MYKILIVDDEFIERDGVKFLIERFAFDLDIEECSDGEEALEHLEKYPVDILLTDIRMPFMDGLELSKRVKKLYPDLKIIIFSGFGEFEYAKTAISIGVRDYILKPINIEEFEKTMNMVINSLEREKQNKIENQRRNLIEKEHILLSLMNGIPLHVLQDKDGWHSEMKGALDYNRMILIAFDKEVFSEHLELSKEIQKKIGVHNDYVNLDAQQSMLFLKEDFGEEKIVAICEKLHENLYQQYKANGYFAISKRLTAPIDFWHIYMSLEDLVETRFFLPKHFVFVEGGSTSLGQTNETFDDEILKSILIDIKNKDYWSLRKHVNYLKEKYIVKNSFSHSYIKFMFSNIYRDIYLSFQKAEGDKIDQEIDGIYQCQSIEEIVENMVSTDITGKRHEVELVKEYIYKKYSTDLGLETLAEYVYMAPSYLSNIFKKETGIGINNFIKNYRMERAKDLLDNTNMKIRDIGSEVGYRNISYFCQNFRDFYGITPEKYRQRDEKNE